MTRVQLTSRGGLGYGRASVDVAFASHGVTRRLTHIARLAEFSFGSLGLGAGRAAISCLATRQTKMALGGDKIRMRHADMALGGD